MKVCMSWLQKLKKKVLYAITERTFTGVSEIKTIEIKQTHKQMNLLWVVFDSCRYDTLTQARTPFLESYGRIYSAWAPATYTLPSHASFFAGILPLVYEPLPYLNRFNKQLITMHNAGQAKEEALGKYSIQLPASKRDVIYGLSKQGYYTVGSAGATWFAKEILTKGFRNFQYKRAQSSKEQVNYILKNLARKAIDKPFFAFMNLMETHTPYMHYGKDREEYSMHIRSTMAFPPQEDKNLIASKGKKLHEAQIEAAEYLDGVMSEFFPQLPANTLVIVTSDHGECFGEDGFWGHGIYHPKVMNVPMMCFMLNREDLQ